jgi:deazaflavin-dependent oxidoreductase (nitroreductase family)
MFADDEDDESTEWHELPGQLERSEIDLEALDGEPFCYLTTVGRRTGRAHTIEIWFTAGAGSLYLISGGGGRSDWVKNLVSDPEASVRVKDRTATVRARVRLPAGPERDAAVDALHAKYRSQVSGTVDDWRRRAFIVALDVVESVP